MAAHKRDDITRAREIRGVTQEQLAQLAGVSTRTVARLEAGENLQPQKLRKLAQALGVTIGFLVGTESGGTAPKLTWGDYKARVQSALGVREISSEFEDRLRFSYESYLRQDDAQT